MWAMIEKLRMRVGSRIGRIYGSRAPFASEAVRRRRLTTARAGCDHRARDATCRKRGGRHGAAGARYVDPTAARRLPRAPGDQGHTRRRVLREHVPHGTQHSAVAPPVQEGAAMRKPRISFRRFSGSGPLSIYWHDGPYGDAVEAVKGRGVAWLAPNGERLGVEFDDVASPADAHTLELPTGDVVTVRVTRGNVTVRQRHRGRKTSAA